MKEFYVVTDSKIEGRIGVKCYGDGGVFLGDKEGLVVGTPQRPLNYNTYYGGQFRQGSDADYGRIRVSNEVKEVYLLIAGGSHMNIKIFSLDYFGKGSIIYYNE